MQKFEVILDRAQKRKGGAEALEDLMPDAPEIDIAKMGDDRILSQFSKNIFQAGFNWSVVEKKWAGIEDAFHRFDIGRNAFMSDDDFDMHLKDTRNIRYAAKILAVRDNAIFLGDLAREYGSAARCIADWPTSDLVGLWQMMKTRGNRLGGNTGQYALRFLGKDCFIMGRDVVTALQLAGVVDGPVTSKNAQAKIQDAFNEWHLQSGETYTRMSRILAMSVGD
jgi:3-methyladenine DNA glycosylase Tag